jgi:hypothetical protein
MLLSHHDLFNACLKFFAILFPLQYKLLSLEKSIIIYYEPLILSMLINYIGWMLSLYNHASVIFELTRYDL